MRKWSILLFFSIMLAYLLEIPTSAADLKLSLSYIYYGRAANYTAQVDQTNSSLNAVSPNYFTLDTAGQLLLSSSLSQTFITEMHSRQIQVVPYITNDWSRQNGIKALENRELLSSAIAHAAELYDLDGVNVDLENLTPSERDSYVDFVRLLREKLPPTAVVSVAVAANPSGLSSGWQGSYDYSALSRYADYLIVMAYDEHYDGSSPGPVASVSFIENSIRYALAHVPKAQLVLCLPFYGRIWSNSGTSPNGFGISNARIMTYLSTYSHTVSIDSQSQSVKAILTLKADDAKPIIYGKPLSTGSYTIWFDNDETLKAKLALISKYELKGAASWSLGQEAATTWSYFKARLNGCNFQDIGSSWAYNNIIAANVAGWVKGIDASTFGPNLPLTRAEAVALIVRRFGYPVSTNTANSFTDTADSWATALINTAHYYGIIEGVGGNSFQPLRTVTREEFAVMLSQARESADSTGDYSFSDVTQTAHPWSYQAIMSLRHAGIITGYPDGTFRPGDEISRAEATALLCRSR